MDYIYADTLDPDQLEIGDWIEIFDGYEYIFVQIKTLKENEKDWTITASDEFGDSNEFTIQNDEKIKLFIFK